MKTFIHTGKELALDELGQINEYRVLEFQSKRLIDPSNNIKDRQDLFFLLKSDEGKLLAFGRMENLEIYFADKPFAVLCVSTVVATQKGQRYGSILMGEIKKFANDKDKTLLGFCETELLPFYKKCGFKILTSEENNFVYVDKNGRVIPDFVPGEVFYIDGSEKVFEKILAASDKTVRVVRDDLKPQV